MIIVSVKLCVICAVQCIIGGGGSVRKAYIQRQCLQSQAEIVHSFSENSRFMQFVCCSYVFDKDGLLSQSSFGAPKGIFLGWSIVYRGQLFVSGWGGFD